MTSAAAIPHPEAVFAGARGLGGVADAVAAILTMTLVVYWPYAFVLDMRTSVNVLGYSLSVTVAPAVIALAGWTLAPMRHPMQATIPAVAAIAVVALAYARWYLGLSETSDVSIAEMVGDRYLVLLPCYLIAARTACNLEWFRCWAPRAIILNGLVSAGLGIAYSIGIVQPSVLPSGTDFLALSQAEIATRASGLFTGPNGFGCFLVFPLILCFAIRLKWGTRMAVCAILFAGILTSQSRTAVAAGALTVLWLSWERSVSFRQRLLRTALVTIVLFAPLQFVQESVSHLGYRGDENKLDTAVRATKTMIGVRALFSDSSTILAGARPSEIILGTDVTQEFSDNSYLQVLTSTGLPVGILFGLSLLWLVSNSAETGCRRQRVLWMYWGAVLSAALVNNSILWDVYMFHAAVVYWLLIKVRAPLTNADSVLRNCPAA